MCVRACLSVSVCLCLCLCLFLCLCLCLCVCTCAPDAIMGVNFYGEEAPEDFGAYDLAIVTVFSMMAGNSWVNSPSTNLHLPVPLNPPALPSSSAQASSIPKIDEQGQLNSGFAVYSLRRAPREGAVARPRVPYDRGHARAPIHNARREGWAVLVLRWMHACADVPRSSHLPSCARPSTHVKIARIGWQWHAGVRWRAAVHRTAHV